MKRQYSIIILSFCFLIHFPIMGQKQSTMASITNMSDDGSCLLNRINKDSTGFELNINPDYFLLGTFYDYMGRFSYVDREKQVDRYYPFEESLAKYVAGFIETNYNTTVELQFDKSRHSEMFSKTIAEKLHCYYDEKGILKKGILDTEEKMYSFLTGVLLRHGENIFDNVFLISVSNSPKRDEIYELLKILECSKIIYKDYRGNIPNITKFYFEATPRIIGYFSLIENENKLIRSEFERLNKEMFKDGYDEVILDREKRDREIENRIKAIFEM